MRLFRPTASAPDLLQGSVDPFAAPSEVRISS